MKQGKLLKLLGIALFLIGCGEDSILSKNDVKDLNRTVETSNVETVEISNSETAETSNAETVGTSNVETAETSTAEIAETSNAETAETPLTYTNRVVNNQGVEVEGFVDGYKIKIYSDTQIEASPQNIHKGIVVKFSGKVSKVIPIDISYLNKNIMIGIYDNEGKRVKASDSIKVTDVPVVIVNL